MATTLAAEGQLVDGEDCEAARNEESSTCPLAPGPRGSLVARRVLFSLPRQENGQGNFESIDAACGHEILPRVSTQTSVARSSWESRRKQLSYASAGSLAAHFGHELSGPMRQVLSDMLTFRGDEDLLRGMPLSVVLRHNGRIFKSSAGSAETYALSKQVPQLEAFISHNWSVSRIKKWVALCFHFHSDVAAWVSIVFVVTLRYASTSKNTTIQIVVLKPYLCEVLFVPVFFFSVLFSRGLLSCVGLKDPKVFLDKTCIHQVDASIQRRGILKLGAFIRKSDEMVILYTDVYLKKLWTVYEVASYLATHGVTGMTIIPLDNSIRFFVLLILTYLMIMTRVVSDLAEFKVGVIMVKVSMLIFWLPFSYVCRCLHYEGAQAESRLSTFQVQECICACEGDRPLVYKNIAMLMQAMEEVHPTCSTEEALPAFDRLVRKHLSKAFAVSFEGRTLRYMDIVIFGFAAKMARRVDKSFDEHGGVAVADVCGSLINEFALTPLLLKSVQACARLVLWLPRGSFAEISLTFLIGVIFAGLDFTSSWIIDSGLLSVKRRKEDMTLVYAGCFGAIVSTVAFVVFAVINPHCCVRWRNRRATEDEDATC
eukprot:TRINITY_DN27416_c0_g1_i1.p1 TRINITY_DN27416_c0_g1~~TRINITY_DN27416_c0_g1_i1.p1  ORF type:complete len:598 (+),score=81.20 TRINITY_DN27416_c0_g1_i1:137-1930(+)